MKKDRYLKLLRVKVLEHIKDIYEGEPDGGIKEKALIKEIGDCTEVNQAIGLLAELGFDVPAAMRFVLEIVVEGLDDEYFCANIPMQWDT